MGGHGSGLSVFVSGVCWPVSYCMKFKHHQTVAPLVNHTSEWNMCNISIPQSLSDLLTTQEVVFFAVNVGRFPLGCFWVPQSFRTWIIWHCYVFPMCESSCYIISCRNPRSALLNTQRSSRLSFGQARGR